ncbi:hypothetical protein [Azospirillum argentinense]
MHAEKMRPRILWFKVRIAAAAISKAKAVSAFAFPHSAK